MNGVGDQATPNISLGWKHSEVRRWHLQCGPELPRRLSQQSSRDEAEPSGDGCYLLVTLSTLQKIAGIAALCRVRFETEMWHPNIYPDGRVCISILHPPGTDRFNDQAKPGWSFSRSSQIASSFDLFSFRKPLMSGGDLSWEFTAFWSVCDPQVPAKTSWWNLKIFGWTQDTWYRILAASSRF